MKEIIKLKKTLSRDDLKITVNIVASKENLQYITDMIKFCIELEVDELSILQFISEGNGRINDQSLSMEESLWLIKEIAEQYHEVKDKIKLEPKFAWPLTQKYAKVVLQKEFPETFSMCGAGNTFFYINNEGVLFPCDRYKEEIIEKNSKDEVSIIDNELWDIAEKDGFDDIFKKTEQTEYYAVLTPCNECEYLRVNCYPCIGRNKQPKQIENTLCKKMMEEIKRVSIK